ncbi:MAG: HEAT repeat domain-containing protein [Polyangiaceae bacterium]
MRRSTRALVAAALLACPRAWAETHGTAPAGGGLPELVVSVDLADGVVEANGARVPISLDRAKLPADAEVIVEPIAVGLGKHVVHVRVPSRDSTSGIAWEGIFASGRTAPIFSGVTGLVDGDPGERTGKMVQTIANGSTTFLLVGDVREDLSLCGQSLTLLDPLALYPSSLTLRPATVQRLSSEQRAGAQKLVATVKGQGADAALARLLVARGSSVAGSRGAELTDGDPNTAWFERRPGAGQGEFVVMAAPRDVPIAKMQVVLAPPDAKGSNVAAPRAFYLVTNTQTFEVTVPEDAWQKPGKSYEIAFPEPIEASCVGLVLDTAYAHVLAHPDVGIAELVAYSEFDGPGASLGDVAKKLSSDRGIAAMQVLERAGDGSLSAVGAAFEGLDPAGRARAMDVAAAHERCEEAAPLLAQGLCSRQGEAPRKAREKLERCKGAASALATRIRQVASERACVAPTLAAIAPEDAIDPIADAIASTPEADAETRAVLRAALSVALNAAQPGRLAKLLSDGRRSATARLEFMRAAGPHIVEAPTESEAVVGELLGGAPPVRARYLVLGPLESLARVGDAAAAARVVAAVLSDSEWVVRARAAGAAAGLPQASASLLVAARDPAPRVREAALQSLAATSSPAAIPVAKALLSGDVWSFVRVQAVAVLTNAPASPDIDSALGRALRDPSVGVRGAAVVALGRHRSLAYRDGIRERLDDGNEDSEVRAAAAGSLGGMCDARSTDRLTELARGLGVPGTREEDQQVALGALVGLANLRPRDLRERLAPLLVAGAPPFARTAAERVLSSGPGSCR